MNRFGISTHLFHEHRLTREHLVHIAAHGFDAIELFATRTHVDYHDADAVTELAEWLADTRLELHSVHAPIVESLKDGKWVGSFSNASSDDARRKAALVETEAALSITRQIPFRYLVLHLGMPTVERVPPGDNQPGAARRSLQDIAELAARVGVGVAVEVIPNPLSSADALAHLIEDELEGLDIGVCLDYGHAHLMGDVAEAVETLSGHLWTTHVHDNGGKRDEHLLPYAGTIDWDAAMMETQKVGYDGLLMFEVADTGDPIAVLKGAVKARERLEKTFVTF
ncbi:MAG TPA: sugar phosphate isomerase/epimerase family protein [Vicinamibacterales bacterium]|nr:sugar phosphate isomerase/epimerase family protein [Vicinamibacterales bacterium]